MARSASEIQSSLIKTAEDQNSTIEVDAGPMYDSSVVPVSSELATVESKTEHLSQMYSTAFIKTASTDDVNAYLTNFSLPLGGGSYAKGICFFATYTRLLPGEEIIIPTDTLVGNSDNSQVYKTTEERRLIGDNISAFYNSTNAWYEVPVPILSANIGTSSNLPANRIRNLLTPIENIDVVYNKNRIKDGLGASSNDQKYQRVENAFFGQDSGVQAGIVKLVESYDENNIVSVAVIPSSDRKLFKRFVNKLALDVYINGMDEQLIQDENYQMRTSSNYIELLSNPVTSIVSVFINGVETTDYQLQKDNTILKQSTLAKDKLVFGSILAKDTILTVSYNYNKLLTNVTNDVFAPNQDSLFDVDILARQMLTQNIILQGQVIPSSSTNKDTLITQVTDKLYSLIETNENGAQYLPEKIRQTLIDQVSGLSNFSWTKFTTKESGYVDVEIITLDKNCVAVIDSNSLFIK